MSSTPHNWCVKVTQRFKWLIPLTKRVCVKQTAYWTTGTQFSHFGGLLGWGLVTVSSHLSQFWNHFTLRKIHATLMLRYYIDSTVEIMLPNGNVTEHNCVMWLHQKLSGATTEWRFTYVCSRVTRRCHIRTRHQTPAGHLRYSVTQHDGVCKYIWHIEQMPRKWRRKGRPRCWWENWVKTGLGRVGEEWRTIAKDRRNWRLLVEKVVRDMRKKKEKHWKSWSTSSMMTTTPTGKQEYIHLCFAQLCLTKMQWSKNAKI